MVLGKYWTDTLGGGSGAGISTGNDDVFRSILMLASNIRLARDVFTETKQRKKSDEWKFTSKIQEICNLRKMLMHSSMFFSWSSVFSHMCSEHTSDITTGDPFTKEPHFKQVHKLDAIFISWFYSDTKI